MRGLPLGPYWLRAALRAPGPLGPCLGLGGLAWAPGRASLPGSLTGSQWGRPCRAAWRLIMAITIGRAPANLGRAPLGGRAPLRARGPPPWAGLPWHLAAANNMAGRAALGLGQQYGPGGGLPWGPYCNANKELKRGRAGVTLPGGLAARLNSRQYGRALMP